MPTITCPCTFTATGSEGLVLDAFEQHPCPRRPEPRQPATWTAVGPWWWPVSVTVTVDTGGAGSPSPDEPAP